MSGVQGDKCDEGSVGIRYYTVIVSTAYYANASQTANCWSAPTPAGGALKAVFGSPGSCRN